MIFGSLTPFAPDIAISSLTGSNGFRIAGESGDGRLGISVSGGGDFNGDGFDDLIVGAHRLTGGQGNYEGAAYVIFSKDGGFSGNLGLSSLTAAQGSALKHRKIHVPPIPTGRADAIVETRRWIFRLGAFFCAVPSHMAWRPRDDVSDYVGISVVSFLFHAGAR